jgi:hypothetical protein
MAEAAGWPCMSALVAAWIFAHDYATHYSHSTNAVEGLSVVTVGLTR